MDNTTKPSAVFSIEKERCDNAKNEFEKHFSELAEKLSEPEQQLLYAIKSAYLDILEASDYLSFIAGFRKGVIAVCENVVFDPETILTNLDF